MKICKGPECDRKAVANGLCGGHHMQVYNGRPLKPLRKDRRTMNLPEGFEYCNKCETFKKRDEFWTRKGGKPRSNCKECTKAKQREYDRKKAKETV